MMKALIWADGAATDQNLGARAGWAGIGAVIEIDGKRKLLAEPFGKATSNEAEYEAVAVALVRARVLKATAGKGRMDSRLVVEQVAGRWKVKEARLLPFRDRVRELLGRFESGVMMWI